MNISKNGSSQKDLMKQSQYNNSYTAEPGNPTGVAASQGPLQIPAHYGPYDPTYHAHGPHDHHDTQYFHPGGWSQGMAGQTHSFVSQTSSLPTTAGYQYQGIDVLPGHRFDPLMRTLVPISSAEPVYVPIAPLQETSAPSSFQQGFEHSHLQPGSQASAPAWNPAAPQFNPGAGMASFQPGPGNTAMDSFQPAANMQHTGSLTVPSNFLNQEAGKYLYNGQGEIQGEIFDDGTYVPFTREAIDQRFSHMPFKPSKQIMNSMSALLKEAQNDGSLVQPDNGIPAGLYKPYLGDENDQSEVPSILNTAVFISGIPQEATRKDIFQAFVEGKIYAFSLKPPVGETYTTAAASVTFAGPEAARAFLRRGNSSPQDPTQGVHILGKRVKVRWNSHPSLGLYGQESRQTRVIQFTIPDRQTTDEFIVWLAATISFELVEESRSWSVGEGRKVIQLSFESIRGQSRAAMKCYLEFANHGNWYGEWSARYAHDPCDPNP